MGLKNVLKRLSNSHDSDRSSTRSNKSTPPASPRASLSERRPLLTSKGSPIGSPASSEPVSVPPRKSSLEYTDRTQGIRSINRRSLPPTPNHNEEIEELSALPAPTPRAQKGISNVFPNLPSSPTCPESGEKENERNLKNGAGLATQESRTSKESKIKREVLGCAHEHHVKRSQEHGDIKEGQPVEHSHSYLQPIIHEQIYQHETAEVTKVVDKQIHTHEVQIHVLPIYRPRRIVTRAKIVVETEVIPEPRLGEAEIDYIGDSIWTTDRDSRDMTNTGLISKESKECEEEGVYQAYAQQVHTRACEMLASYVNKEMALFEKSLVTSPIKPITPLLPHSNLPTSYAHNNVTSIYPIKTDL